MFDSRCRLLISRKCPFATPNNSLAILRNMIYGRHANRQPSLCVCFGNKWMGGWLRHRHRRNVLAIPKHIGNPCARILNITFDCPISRGAWMALQRHRLVWLGDSQRQLPCPRMTAIFSCDLFVFHGVFRGTLLSEESSICGFPDRDEDKGCCCCHPSRFSARRVILCFNSLRSFRPLGVGR